MKIFRSIKWALGLLLVFGLVIATNLIDKNNFIQVKNAVVTIYEDRLVADDLVYDMTNIIHKKELAVAKKDSNYFISQSKNDNHLIQENINKFEETKLTQDEYRIFKKLQSTFKKLQKSEAELIDHFPQSKVKINILLADMKNQLFELSQIQIEEGKRQMAIGNKAIETIDLFTKIEIYMLIFLAILIQIIVIYQPKQKTNRD